MPLTLDQWFLAQCHREDSVGSLARLWVEESHKNLISNTEMWLNGKKSNPEWQKASSTAIHEYAISVECLKKGESSPTFRRLFASSRIEKILKQSSEEHRAHPEVSPELHLRRKHLGLFQALEGRTLVYLDTNHWLNLRHVVLGSAQALSIYGKILLRINELALTKRLLCPVSFPLFFELMKQTDKTTRLATARLMDCLSGGVCFQFPLDIERLELRQKMLQSILRDKSPDLSDQVWTKVGYINGEMLPFNESLPKEAMCFLQKLSIDGMWATPLDHFAEFDASRMASIEQQKIAEATNTDAAWYRSAKMPFEEILEREKAFLIRSLLKEMEQITKEIWDDYPTHRDVTKLPPCTEGASPWALPSVQVLAGINAALIASSKKFTQNDILDFRHAALAVPYCDALFCDGPMAHVLRSKPLEFDKVYQTSVLSRPEDILQYLQKL